MSTLEIAILHTSNIYNFFDPFLAFFSKKSLDFKKKKLKKDTLRLPTPNPQLFSLPTLNSQANKHVRKKYSFFNRCEKVLKI